jgi:tRNA pseudouridine55 synthase
MNGVVVIDKPPGMTSHDVVAGIRRVLGIRKIGHAGTLDPLATGVLAVCINEATKLVPFFDHHRKAYQATLRLGMQTDTLDREGRVIAQQVPQVTPDAVEAVLKTFVGKIEQTPPRYSAVKFRGKPLYAWARRGIAVEALPRIVEIYSVTVDRIDLPDVTFQVTCGKGAYIRSLCADAGERLGCGACLMELRRTASGPFTQEQALSLEGLTSERQRSLLSEALMRLTDALPDLTAMTVDADMQSRLRIGSQLTAEAMKGHDIPFLAAGDMIKFVTTGGDLVAVSKALYASDEMPSLPQNVQVFKILRGFSEAQNDDP